MGNHARLARVAGSFRVKPYARVADANPKVSDASRAGFHAFNPLPANSLRTAMENPEVVRAVAIPEAETSADTVPTASTPRVLEMISQKMSPDREVISEERKRRDPPVTTSLKALGAVSPLLTSLKAVCLAEGGCSNSCVQRGFKSLSFSSR